MACELQQNDSGPGNILLNNIQWLNWYNDAVVELLFWEHAIAGLGAESGLTAFVTAE